VIDVYARLSYLADGTMVNVEEQVDMGQEDVEGRGAVVGETFVDAAKSAWNPKVRRPQWEKLMARLESGESDGVWVLDVTRFSRKILEGERLVEVARRGRAVWSYSGGYNLATADGRKAFRDATTAAAAESDKISERTKRGKRRKAKRGLPVARLPAFGTPRWEPKAEGWEPGDARVPVPAEVIEAEREVVRECYRRLLAGETNVSALAWELNGRGVLTVNGKQWSRTTLVDMLLRPPLAGLVVVRGEIVGVERDADPAVSREEWERMRALLAARRRGRPAGRVHPLSGLVRCGTCGRKLAGAVVRRRKVYGDGTPYREYRCRREAARAGCGANSIDARVAEAAVAEAVRTRLGDPRHTERVARRMSTASTRRAEVSRELAHLDEQMDELSQRTAKWGLKRVDAAMEPLLAQVEKLNAELADIEAPDSPARAVGDVTAEWDRAEADGDVDAIRTMVKSALPNLVLRAARGPGDHDPARFDWDGTTDGTPLPRPTDLDRMRPLLARAEGATVADVADHLGKDRTAVFRQLQRLERDGTVTRTVERDAQGRRTGIYFLADQ
jgi:DNA invertase Pin-like site-specific DNA recombinase